MLAATLRVPSDSEVDPDVSTKSTTSLDENLHSAALDATTSTEHWLGSLLATVEIQLQHSVQVHCGVGVNAVSGAAVLVVVAAGASGAKLAVVVTGAAVAAVVAASVVAAASSFSAIVVAAAAAAVVEMCCGAPSSSAALSATTTAMQCLQLLRH